MLELNKLTDQVAEMAEVAANQRSVLQDLTRRARSALEAHDRVTAVLRQKLNVAANADPSWRGADPLGDRLNMRRSLPQLPLQATLLASDGSQVYPDPHGTALYYLLNVGTIVLRQGSGLAPSTATQCRIFYQEADLYDDHGLIETDTVNAQRDLWELEALAGLAIQERSALGGDLDQTLVALADGPLLPWMPQRLSDAQQEQRVGEFARELGALRQVRAVPIGYVDRPRSANILRLLHLAQMPMEQITKERLRRDNPYRGLSDRILFDDLAPGQRTGLFAATSEINDTYGREGHRIFFCYLNVARDPGSKNSRIVRVETPEWATRDEAHLDSALAAVWADCRLTDYPYVLVRAHELAVVKRHEREALNRMLEVELMRHRLRVEPSAKQRNKTYVG